VQANNQSGRPVRIFLVAGEASGDILAAELIEPLREQFNGAIEFAGIGGSAMKAQGIDSPINMSALTVLGYLEGLMAWWRIRRLARQTADYAKTFQADLVILVDSWGYTMRVAHAIRRTLPQAILVKYVGPQVWASRPKRAYALAQAVDHLLTIHAFDEPYYKDTGLPVTFVGNPVLARYVKGNASAIRETYSIAPNAKILLVLFGSRSAEFKRLHEPFAEAVERLRAKHPDLVVLCPVSKNIATQVHAAAADDPRLQSMIFLTEAQHGDAFATADLALACSGTVTTELAMAGVPMIVGYKIGTLSWLLLKHFFLTTRYVTLVNVVADKQIVPEFLQNACTPQTLFTALDVLLNDESKRKEQAHALAQATQAMGAGKMATPQRVAKAVSTLWRAKN
jgi:lipid-A-disaccharide synthase